MFLLLLYHGGCDWHKQWTGFMRTLFHTLSFAALVALAACAPTRPILDQPAGPQSASSLSATSSLLPAKAGASPLELPGKRPDGSVLLPNHWSLRPAGRQVELGDLPINVAVHPAGRFAAVLHSGYSAHEIRVVDIAAAKVVSRTGVHEAFYGLEFSKDGRQLFCSGAGDEVVHCFEFQQGSLTNHHQLKLRDAKLRAVPAGLAVDAAATRLFVANVWGDRITRVDLSPQPKVADILLRTSAASLAVAPATASADFDTEAATKREEASLYQAGTGDSFPYACRLDERRQRLYVSLWAQAAVAVIDLKAGQVVARWPTQEHPCEMALTRSGRRLFVANASRNTVTVFDTESGRVLETICAALTRRRRPVPRPTAWRSRRTNRRCMSRTPTITSWRSLTWPSRARAARSGSFRWVGIRLRCA